MTERNKKKKKKSRQSQTMGDLLTKTDEEINIPQKGDELLAEIAEITPNRIYFNINAKTEGVLFGRELEQVSDFVDTLKVNEKVAVVVGQAEDPRGQILLNLKNSARKYAWNFYNKKIKNDQPVVVVGLDQNSGGILVEAPFNLTGFIPGSCLGANWLNKEEQLKGKKIKVKIIEVNEEQNRLVFSERAVSEAGEIAEEKKVLSKIEKGDKLKAKIVKIAPYGLFIEAEKNGVVLEGLVHISEISWQKVDNLEELYHEGEEIMTRVLKKEDGRLQLSIKNLQSDPWQEVVKKYPESKEITGHITKITSFGWLINLEKGVEGLVHISKIPTNKKVNVGDEIKCFIESVDVDNRRISLGVVLTKKPIGYK